MKVWMGTLCCGRLRFCVWTNSTWKPKKPNKVQKGKCQTHEMCVSVAYGFDSMFCFLMNASSISLFRSIRCSCVSVWMRTHFSFAAIAIFFPCRFSFWRIRLYSDIPNTITPIAQRRCITSSKLDCSTM